jgi:protoheme IX farnesyltransferase
MRYREDYAAAGIPTFPSTYGDQRTRLIIAVASVLAAGVMGTAAVLIGVRQGTLHLLGILSGGLLVMALLMLLKPSSRLNFHLFKFASVYMLASMLLLAI